MDLMARGVVLVSVTDGSLASAQGFQPGDIIRAVNGANIGSAAQLQAALAAKSWDMVVERGGQRLSLRVSE